MKDIGRIDDLCAESTLPTKQTSNPRDMLHKHLVDRVAMPNARLILQKKLQSSLEAIHNSSASAKQAKRDKHEQKTDEKGQQLFPLSAEAENKENRRRRQKKPSSGISGTLRKDDKALVRYVESPFQRWMSSSVGR